MNEIKIGVQGISYNRENKGLPTGGPLLYHYSGGGQGYLLAAWVNKHTCCVHRSPSRPNVQTELMQAAAQATTLEYGNTASLRAVVESCSCLTNARLVHLMMGPYRLKSHLRVLKKFMLHGQVM